MYYITLHIYNVVYRVLSLYVVHLFGLVTCYHHMLVFFSCWRCFAPLMFMLRFGIITASIFNVSTLDPVSSKKKKKNFFLKNYVRLFVFLTYAICRAAVRENFFLVFRVQVSYIDYTYRTKPFSMSREFIKFFRLQDNKFFIAFRLRQ